MLAVIFTNMSLKKHFSSSSECSESKLCLHDQYRLSIFFQNIRQPFRTLDVLGISKLTVSVHLVDTFFVPQKDIRQGLRTLDVSSPRAYLLAQMKNPSGEGFFICASTRVRT